MNKHLLFILALLITSFLFISTNEVHANSSTLAPGATLDLSPNANGTADIEGYLAGVTAIRGINGAGSAYAEVAWNSATLADAQLKSYTIYTAPAGFIPDEYTVYYIKTANNQYYKLRINGTNSTSGIPLEYDYLGEGTASPPSADFTFSSYDLITNFTDASTGAASWSWDFDDTTSATYQSPQRVFDSAGTYNVCLTATNTGGDDTTCKDVTVTELPSTTVAAGGSIDFDGDTVNDMQLPVQGGCGIYSFVFGPVNGATWSFMYQDYRTVDLADVQAQALTSTGTFCPQLQNYYEPMAFRTGTGSFVKFWVADGGSSARIVFEVLQGALPDEPVASFTYSTLDLTAFFTDASTNDPTSWAWDFDGEGTSSSENPYFRFETEGTYNVCLTATNAGGSSSPACQDVTVSEVDSITLTPNQSYDLDSDGVNDVIALAETNSMSLQGVNLGGIGSLGVNYYTATIVNLQAVTYASNPFGLPHADPNSPLGVRTGTQSLIKLWAPDNDSNTSIRIQFEVLVDGSNPPDAPVAGFTADTTDASGLGLMVNFTDISTNTPTQWAWDFDDSGSSSSQNPSHTFAAAGQYNVCLTATNAGGNDVYCEILTITQPPSADFDYAVSSLEVTFTDSSTDSPAQWTWDFDDGNTSTSQNPVHSYGASGTYNVCLTVENAGGTDTNCRSVNLPDAEFTYVVDILDVDFTDTTAITVSDWLWDFGDSNTSTVQNPSHTYISGGTFTVCLTVTSGGVVSAPECQSIAILAAVPTAPTGVMTITNPTYQWTSPAGADGFELTVTTDDNQTIAAESFDLTVCSGADCSIDLTTLSENYSLLNGSYKWSVRASLGSIFGGWSDPTEFTVSVAPTVTDDSYTTPFGTTLTVTAPGVLSNDETNASDNMLNATSIDAGATTEGGTVTVNTNGSFVYTPPAGFSGDDTFTYTANDGANTSTAATVTITVESNIAPTAIADTYETPFNTSLNVGVPGVLGNDTDVEGASLSAVVITEGATTEGGTITLNSSGSFTYMPAAGFSGEDTFTYTNSDGTSTSSNATVTITVAPNTTPTAVADSYETPFNTSLNINAPGVLNNDMDAEGSSLSAVVIASGVTTQGGTVTLNVNGSFTYTPAVGFSGNDTFTYTNSDGNDTSNAATVTITVADAVVVIPVPGTVNVNLPVEGPAIPQISWQQSTPAPEWYQIIVVDNDGTTIVDQWLSISEVCDAEAVVCTFDIASLLPFGFSDGDYTITINGWLPDSSNPNGVISVIATGSFSVSLTRNIVEVSSGRPVITFNDDENIEWVNLYIGTSDYNQTIEYQWYEKATQISCDGITCTLIPSTDPAMGSYGSPANGDYVVYLQGWNGTALTFWSGGFEFTLSFEPAGEITPLTSTYENGQVNISWLPAPHASWYQLWVGMGEPEWSLWYLQWHMASDLDCESGTCSIELPGTNLQSGKTYVWYVQAWGPGGTSVGGVIDGWVQGLEFIP